MGKGTYRHKDGHRYTKTWSGSKKSCDPFAGTLPLPPLPDEPDPIEAEVDEMLAGKRPAHVTSSHVIALRERAERAKAAKKPPD